jgi:menaquinone-dependent protoporphyrinogen oxidase
MMRDLGAPPIVIQKGVAISWPGGSMLKLLLAYASTEGQTRKIAGRMAVAARAAGHVVTEVECGAVPRGLDPATFDGIIVGASVHQGKHQPSAVEFARRFRAALRDVPSAFFSVSLEAALVGEEHQDMAHRYIREFLAETGWDPDLTRPVAGALRNSEYDFLKRLAMKFISRREGLEAPGSGDYEFTDWEGVRRFVAEFAAWAERRRALRPHAAATPTPR